MVMDCNIFRSSFGDCLYYMQELVVVMDSVICRSSCGYDSYYMQELVW